MKRGRVAVLCALLVAGAWEGLRLRDRGAVLPAQLTWDELVADLSASFAPDVVVAQRSDAPVQIGGLQPAPESDIAGGRRQAVIAPAPSHLRWQTQVPPDAHLTASIALDDTGSDTAAPVRFEVLIDGAPRFTRVLDRAAGAEQRRWIDVDIDLASEAGRAVPIELRTTAVGEGSAAARPGWARVRCVRRNRRTRQPASSGPNVILVIVDTLRADRVGACGGTPTRTPALDAFAAGGAAFTQMTAQSSWTLLSVPSMLSGLHPRSHGVWGEMNPANAPPNLDATYLADEVTTLAETAADAGITTMAIVTNPVVSRSTNILQGFESVIEYGQEKTFDPEGRSEDYAPASLVNRQFVDWLRRNRRHRFFAYLHFMEPHGPYRPHPEFRPPLPAQPLDVAARAGQPMPFMQRMQKGGPPPTVDDIAYLSALYDGDVRSWDAAFGQLRESLQRTGVLEHTIVVVTSDHGEEFFEHGQLRHGTQLFDETTHVPLVIVGPGIAPQRIGLQAQGIDLFPTIAARLGATPPPQLPGQDLFAAPDERMAVSELAVGTAGEQVSARTPRGKWISRPLAQTGVYFDLQADPGERTPHATHPHATVLQRGLESWRGGVRHPPHATARRGADPDAIRQRLRALGYLE